MTQSLPPMAVASRAARLATTFEAAGVDALLVTHGPNVAYLSGFTGSAAMLLVMPTALTLVTDGRYARQAELELAAAGVQASIEMVRGERERLAAVMRAAGDVRRLGLEADHVSWSFVKRLDEREPGASVLQPTTGLVEALRAVKDEGEIARIEEGARLADEALHAVRPSLVAGISEREVALELEIELRRRGAVDRAFEVIVASGPNAALPHATPTDRVLEEGDLLLLDFGALVDGYRSDVSRTFCIGEPSPTQLRMLEVVTAAQAAGVAAVAEGVAGGQVDRVCREFIAEAGWGDAFLHTTGHGIGLDLHELPWLEHEGDATLVAGHVVSVEPGVYLPEHGGVRVEDLVVVTPDGARTLTQSPKDWIP